MKTVPTIRRLKGFRFPREIISYAVWAYHRFALSTADVEDRLAERGVRYIQCTHSYKWDQHGGLKKSLPRNAL